MKQINDSLLRHLAIIHLSGPDTLTFLQGQCTQDTARLRQNLPIAGGFCNAKGRLISTVQLVLVSDEPTTVMLIGEASGMQALHEHLKKYAPLFRRMTVDFDQQHFNLFGIADQPETVLSKTRSADDPISAVMPWGAERTLVCTRSPAWPDELADYEPITPEHWRYQDIEEQFLLLDGEQSAVWIPQNVSLDELDGVSFKKGCYTGQEVVARLHYKGQSKKRLFRIKLPTTAPHLNGPVFAADSKIGDIIQFAAGEQNSIALAVLKVDKTDEPLTIGEDRQVPVELLH